MANQFNFNALTTCYNPDTGESQPITVQTVKVTDSKTPLAQAPIVTTSHIIAPDCGQVTFTGAEWQALIDALDSYQPPLSDLAEIMPADNDIPFIPKTTHPVTGDMVSRDEVMNELACLALLQVRINDEMQSKTLDLLQGQQFDPADFGNEDKEIAHYDIAILAIIVNAIQFAIDTANSDIAILQAEQQGAKDKATKTEIKRLTAKLNQLARLNDILLGVIHAFCVWLCEQTGENPDSLEYTSPNGAISCLQELWHDFINSITTDANEAGSHSIIDPNTALSYSLTQSICQLNAIKHMLQAIDGQIGEQTPDFKQSPPYKLFATLGYMVESLIKNRTNEKNAWEAVQ